MKVLVIGQNPSPKPTLNGKPNATFRKLELWMTAVGVHHFSFVNTFDEPGVKPTHNNVDYTRLCTLTQEYDKIISLGSFVSTALNKIGVAHYSMPHPSPLNRLLNDKDYERTVISKCKEYLK